jgi:hypothetical protein
MLTVDEFLNVLLMEKALGGPMRSDDCPTVVRMGGDVHPHYPAPPLPKAPEPTVETTTPPVEPTEQEKK